MSEREEVVELKQNFWAYVKRQFKKNKRAMFSLYFIGFLTIVALSADFIANEKPIYCKYKGKSYFPILKSYGVALGIAKWPPELLNVQWDRLDYESKIFPPIPYSPTNSDMMNGGFTSPFGEQRFTSKEVLSDKKLWHKLGTDDLGRDVLAGMIHATRIALTVGIVSMSIATLIGIFFGAFAGFFGDDGLKISRLAFFLNVLFFFLAFFYAFSVRSYTLSNAMNTSAVSFLLQLVISALIFFGVMALANLLAMPFRNVPWLGEKVNFPVDLIVSRLIEIMVSIPRLFLIIAIVAVMTKGSLFIVMMIIGFTSWTGIARLIRAELLKVRNLEYLEAAEALGYGNARRLLRHAIPNALSPVFIAVAFGVASAILIEAFLSFIGIGVPADIVTWGSLLNLARTEPTAWWLAIFPGFAIFITVTLFNLIGEGLTDALDPKLKK